MEKSYKEYLQHITTFIFDVDGVLTDGTVTVTTSGEMLRKMNIKDGYALKTAVDKDIMCVLFRAVVMRAFGSVYEHWELPTFIWVHNIK